MPTERRARLPLPRFPSSVPRSSSGAAADHSGAGRGLSGVPGLNTLSKSGTTGERAGGANNIGALDHGAAGAPLLVLLIIRLLFMELLFIIRPGAAVCPRAAVYHSPWCS